METYSQVSIVNFLYQALFFRIMLSENKQELYKMLTESKRMKREINDLFNDKIIQNDIRYYKHIESDTTDLWNIFYWYIEKLHEDDIKSYIIREKIDKMSVEHDCDYTISLYDFLLYIDNDIALEVDDLEYIINHYKLDKRVESYMTDARQRYDMIKKEHKIAKILNQALKDVFATDKKINQRRIREPIQESKSDKINNRMDRTHGLTHIHASKHPLDLHAKKITPKRKNSIEQLENSVRRMF